MAHVEAVKEYRSGGEGDLGQLEHYSDLEDEVYAFAAVFALFFGGRPSRIEGVRFSSSSAKSQWVSAIWRSSLGRVGGWRV